MQEERRIASNYTIKSGASQVALEVKKPPAKAGDVRGAVSVPGSGRSTTHPNILVGKIPWTEEPGGLQSIGSQRVKHS